MIILKDEENAIVNLFDTAKEFKEYILEVLNEMEKGMIADGEGTIFNTDIEEQGFHNQLAMYLDLTDETVEIK
jgi:N-acetylglutamate synthase/N-acetylornithine aminotransferase